MTISEAELEAELIGQAIGKTRSPAEEGHHAEEDHQGPSGFVTAPTEEVEQVRKPPKIRGISRGKEFYWISSKENRIILKKIYGFGNLQKRENSRPI